MMHDVNWWLMALSFLLGLVLTLLFMIGHVTREVPIYAALGRGPKVAVKKAAPVAAAAAAATPVVAKVVKDEPYGTGSVRVAKSVAPPRTEYLVKGDEDTMRYFTVESPDYEKVGAEVWFKDTASADRAGFLRWDVAGEGAGASGSAAAAKSTIVSGEPVGGPYGEGSALPGEGGVGPAGWTIKGNMDSGLYHTPASPSYEQTIAEVWFRDEATAEAAGFKKYK